MCFRPNIPSTTKSPSTKPHRTPTTCLASKKMSLRDLPDARMMTITTLYVPPKGEKPIDRMRLTQLGLTETDITKTWGQLT